MVKTWWPPRFVPFLHSIIIILIFFLSIYVIFWFPEKKIAEENVVVQKSGFQWILCLQSRTYYKCSPMYWKLLRDAVLLKIIMIILQRTCLLHKRFRLRNFAVFNRQLLLKFYTKEAISLQITKFQKRFVSSTTPATVR